MKRYLLTTFVVLAILFINSNIYAATYEYDSLNRLSKVTYDDGLRIVYDYDVSGNRSMRLLTVEADVDASGNVDLEDFAELAYYWLSAECEYPDLCGGTDFDWSGEVGIEDLATLASYWLASMD